MKTHQLKILKCIFEVLNSAFEKINKMFCAIALNKKLKIKRYRIKS